MWNEEMSNYRDMNEEICVLNAIWSHSRSLWGWLVSHLFKEKLKKITTTTTMMTKPQCTSSGDSILCMHFYVVDFFLRWSFVFFWWRKIINALIFTNDREENLLFFFIVLELWHLGNRISVMHWEKREEKKTSTKCESMQNTINIQVLFSCLSLSHSLLVNFIFLCITSWNVCSLCARFIMRELMEKRIAIIKEE